MERRARLMRIFDGESQDAHRLLREAERIVAGGAPPLGPL
jgi:hypothetical protein